MYNKLLDTFVLVAELGSFSKAAEQLFITPTAVVKQINQLEYDMNLKLFSRSRRGVVLTPTGVSILNDARYLINYSKESLSIAREAEKDSVILIRIGTSILRSCSNFSRLCSKIINYRQDIRIQLIQFDDASSRYQKIIRKLGTDFDIIGGVYPQDLWNSSCNVLKLYESPICCAVPQSHRLARKKKLSLQDLYGEKLLMHIGGGMDIVRGELTKYPEISIVDTYYYDLDTFNASVASNTILLTSRHWLNIHPQINTIPVDWDYKIPFGLLYSSTPHENVKIFIETIQDILDKEGYPS